MPTYKKPTADEIKRELDWLKANRDKVRKYSGFGDANRPAIDAEIEVLENDMDDNAILAKQLEEGEDDDSKWTEYQVNSARDARQWVDGWSADSPSKNWGPAVEGGKK